MARRVVYEWDIETVDRESGDILDHDFRDALREFPRMPTDEGERLVLVRYVNDDAAGEIDRQWAYVGFENRSLPRYFTIPGPEGDIDTDITVPKRFHRETAKEFAR